MPPETRQPELHRIAKLLARAGVASRREIERMVAEGRVAVKGQVIDTPATLLASLAYVTVDGNPVAAAEPARLFLYHKPSGLLTTERDPAGRPTIYDRLPRGLPRVMPVGRLDLSTEGLLLLTTDGGLKRTLELPATGVERAYRARAYGAVTQEALESLIDGVEIEGVRYGSIDANLERRTGANTWIEMTLTEGKNREVRRVLEYLGLKVSRLIRTRYGPFHLGDLPVGEVVEVRRHDVESLVANPRRKDLPQPRRRGPAEPRPVARPSVAAASPPRPSPARAVPGNGRPFASKSAPADARPQGPKPGPGGPKPFAKAPGAGGKPIVPKPAARAGKAVRTRADGSLAVRGGGRRAERAKAFRTDGDPSPSPRTPRKR
jgi:23S rRNA pseudouridine2605 synthase